MSLMLRLSPLLVVIGCGPPTFNEVYEDVLQPQCATGGCHDADHVAGLDMSTEQNAFDYLYNVQATTEGATLYFRVIPEDAENSLLSVVLDEPVGEVRQMPPSGPLDDASINLIRAWIDGGALREQ